MTPSAPPRSTIVSLLVGGLVPAMAVILGLGILFFVLDGRPGGLTALVGGVLGAALLAAGMFALSVVVRPGRSAAGMIGLALGLFGVQLAITGAIVWALVQLDWVEARTLAIAFIAAGLTFQIGSSISFLRARVPVVEPLPEGDAAEAAPAATHSAPDAR